MLLGASMLSAACLHIDLNIKCEVRGCGIDNLDLIGFNRNIARIYD
jgi:hypothetical protein